MTNPRASFAVGPDDFRLSFCPAGHSPTIGASGTGSRNRVRRGKLVQANIFTVPRPCRDETDINAPVERVERIETERAPPVESAVHRNVRYSVAP
jgi:hypothetical protein